MPRKASPRWWVLGALLVAAATLLSALHIVRAATAPAPRRALLVGISDYPQRTNLAWPRLHTKSDIEMLKRVLIERYAFAEQDVLVLEDRAATAQGIRDAFRQHLVAAARPGAVLFFHFSGHGQQVADQNGDESDGMDESLVPFDAEDSRAATGAKVNIRDDEIGAWLKEIAARMKEPNQANGKVRGDVLISIDSCYSGTATRGALVERGRGWDESIDGPRPRQPASASAVDNERGVALRDGVTELHFLGAAQSDQRAKERDRDGLRMGVYTWALVGALQRASNTTTYRALHDQIVYDVMAETREQLPQLDGEPDRILFGGSAPPPQPYLPVREQRGEDLIIPAGTLQLVSAGSIYALHVAGSAPMTPATLLAEATVETTGTYESALRLLPAYRGKVQAQALRGARAVEIAHSYPDLPLRIYLANVPASLLESLRGRDSLLVPSIHSADLWIERDEKSGMLRVYRPTSPQPIYATSATNIDGLHRLFRREWRFRQLLLLQRENPKMNVELRIVPQQVQFRPDGAMVGAPVDRTDVITPPGAVLALREGDYYTFELHNPTSTPLYVTVLELGSDGSVSVAFPDGNRSNDALAPEARQNFRSTDLFRMSPPAGRSIFKVIATKEPVSWNGLVQAAVVMSCRAGNQRKPGLESRINKQIGAAPASLRPLSQLLADMTSGQRGFTPRQVSIEAFGVSTVALDQVGKDGTTSATRDPCAEAARGAGEP